MEKKRVHVKIAIDVFLNQTMLMAILEADLVS